jgi:hypothetical protein
VSDPDPHIPSTSVNCHWLSLAHSFFVSGPVETFMCFKRGPLFDERLLVVNPQCVCKWGLLFVDRSGPTTSGHSSLQWGVTILALTHSVTIRPIHLLCYHIYAGSSDMDDRVLPCISVISVQIRYSILK